MTELKLDADATPHAVEVLVASNDYQSLQTCTKFFEESAPRAFIRQFDEIHAALNCETTSKIVVPVSTPIRTLEKALHDGVPASEALTNWRAQAKEIIVACRAARHRIVLVDTAMLLEQPDSMAKELATRLELDLCAPQLLSSQTEQPMHSSLLTAVAAALMSSDPAALDLRDEIEAMLLGPASPSVLSLTEVESVALAVSALTEERDLLREYLQAALLESAQISNEHQQRYAEIQKVRHSLDAAKYELAEAKRLIKDLYQSTSWRVTAPLRAIRLMFERP